MKTTPMEHQKIGRKHLRKNPKFFGLGCDQGTGKTWMILDDMEYQFKKGLINGVLILAPKGVHTNWVLREIPKHLETKCRVGVWRSNPGIRRMRTFREMLEIKNVDRLDVFSVNIDALVSQKVVNLCYDFIKAHKCMIVVDESSRIKSKTASCTKKIIQLGKGAVSKRIASGTMVTNGPPDLFSQFEFLSPGGGLLGETSYRCFMAQYCRLVDSQSPRMYAIRAKMRPGMPEPQIVDRDSLGRPLYKNEDKLGKLMSPHVYRVLKSECLDLPPKVYQTYSYIMPPKARAVYEILEQELNYTNQDGEIDTYTALTVITKLRQVISGFIITKGEPTELIDPKVNPRLDLLKETIEEIGTKQFIIWATFRKEFEMIREALKSMNISTGEYHGAIKPAARELSVDRLQSGDNQCFLGHPKSGGIGLTLTAAEASVYYSRDFALEPRLQSEDRNHRHGTKSTIVYTDIVAENSIDEKIALALQAKEDVANKIYSYL